jgi:hypothetical protein
MSAGLGRRCLRLDVFFILQSFPSGDLAGAEDSHCFLPRRKTNQQQTRPERVPYYDLPPLVDRVVFVVENSRQGVCEDCKRFVE